MTNPFDKLFNASTPSNLFSTDDNNGAGGLFDNKVEPAKKEEAAKKEEPAKTPESNEPEVEADLFGEPIVPEEKQKEFAEPKKAEPVKSQPKKAEPKKEEAKKAEKVKPKKTPLKDIRVSPSWNIAYAAQQNNPPEVDMTLEEVRQWMELDYPELSLERTGWDVDEEKQLIVPIVKGAKMG